MLSDAATATLPDIPGWREHFGVRLAFIGDDGDWIVALGRHEPRRMVAAVSRHVRVDLGWPSLRCETDWSPDEAFDRVHHDHAVLATSCRAHGSTKDPALLDCADCREIAATDWWLTWDLPADTPGSFPVTVMEV